MAARNHAIVHKSAVYAPITAILVPISMFSRSTNAIKQLSDISRDAFTAKNQNNTQNHVYVQISRGCTDCRNLCDYTYVLVQLMQQSTF